MESNLDKSLEDLIQGKSSRRRGNGGAVVGNGRKNRQVTPYGSTSASGKRTPVSKPFQSQQLSLKFLITHEQAGSLIGTGGQTITECKELSKAIIHVSNSHEMYPGRSERVLYITGSDESVDSAQSYVWHMIANTSHGSAEWSPRRHTTMFNDSHIESLITIPLEAAGMILGRGGSTIKQIADESGAKLSLRSKDEAAESTGERVASISGTLTQCIACTSLVLAKFQENMDISMYPTRGSSYPLQAQHAIGGGGGGGGGGRESSVRYSHRGADRESHSMSTSIFSSSSSSLPSPVGLISALTTITLAVPDQIIGNMLGKQGATLKEVMLLSGADITISGRGEFIAGTRNRLVKIEGEPSAAQTAHTLIKNKLAPESSDI